MNLLNSTAYVPQSDGSLSIQTQVDVAPALERAAALRSAGRVGNSDNRHIASISMEVVNELCKQNGVAWNDTHARNELLKKKLLDGTLANFRVWEGTY